jgi:hypothetical protein
MYELHVRTPYPTVLSVQAQRYAQNAVQLPIHSPETHESHALPLIQTVQSAQLHHLHVQAAPQLHIRFLVTHDLHAPTSLATATTAVARQFVMDENQVIS